MTLIILLIVISAIWFIVGVFIGFVLAVGTVEDVVTKLKRQNEILLSKTKK